MYKEHLIRRHNVFVLTKDSNHKEAKSELKGKIVPQSVEDFNRL